MNTIPNANRFSNRKKLCECLKGSKDTRLYTGRLFKIFSLKLWLRLVLEGVKSTKSYINRGKKFKTIS